MLRDKSPADIVMALWGPILQLVVQTTNSITILGTRKITNNELMLMAWHGLHIYMALKVLQCLEI